MWLTFGWIRWNCEKYLALNACYPAWQSQQWKMFVTSLVGEYKNGCRQMFKDVLILQIRKHDTTPFPTLRCVKHDYLLAEWSRLSSNSPLFTAKLCRPDAMDCEIRYIWGNAINMPIFGSTECLFSYMIVTSLCC